MSFIEEVTTILENANTELIKNKIQLNTNEISHRNYFYNEITKKNKECKLDYTYSMEYKGINLPHNKIDIFVKNEKNDKV